MGQIKEKSEEKRFLKQTKRCFTDEKDFPVGIICEVERGLRKKSDVTR